MLDLKLIRENPALVKEGMIKLNADAPIDEIVALDVERRNLITQSDNLKNERNTRSKEIGKEKDPERRASLISEMHGVNAGIKELDDSLARVEEKLNHLLLLVPNMPRPYVPVGKDEKENVVVRHWGERKTFSFKPKPHWELGEELGIIDFERGVKISGTRFYVLKGLGARLQRALIAFMLDLHTGSHNYSEIYPPYMVKRECLVGTGNLPKFAENLYTDQEDDFWFIPTAEVPVTNLYREEILEESQLPIYHVAYTACFRREKMSAGKETRGLKRGHQFDKVELVKFVHPDSSDRELEKLLSDAEDVLRTLNLPYRVVQMCTGDLSFSAAAKYDPEVWAPGSEEWLEVSSCSNFCDFQARRAGIRFRRANGKIEYVHTLNGSGLALPRTMIAVMENYQEADGSITIPEPLRPYMGGIERITRADVPVRA